MLAIEKSPVHGTAVAVGGRGFLFLGPSGSGKSGLGLQMIALGAMLVSDDQIVLTRDGARVILTAPTTLEGLIEARGVGILTAPQAGPTPLYHVVDLSKDSSARLPQLHSCDVLGARIDLINGRNVPNLASLLMILGRGERHS